LAKKNELELIVEHWQCKELGNYPNKNQPFGIAKELVGHTLVTIQTHPSSFGCPFLEQ